MEVVEANNNFIVRVSRGDKRIELWSKQRLPFEPKGWLLEMRNMLKDELKALEPFENSILYAKYASEVKGFFDVENILFYNVGASSFSRLCQKRLCFERLFSNPPELPNECSPSPMQHYQSYEVTEAPPSNWRKEKTVALWTDVKCPPLHGDIKPHLIWYNMKNGNVKVNSNVDLSDLCGIDITINASSDRHVNLAKFIKPILDGIISAFHYHSGENLVEAANRLSLEIEKNADETTAMLSDRRNAVLGRRELLLMPYRQGIKWDPADDVIVYGKITLETSNVSDDWTHSGEIYTVKEQI